ncbi:MAG: TIGR02466 family protein [Bdellovibrionota bacterium]
MPIQSWFPTSIYAEPLVDSGLVRFNREIEEQCYLVRETDPQGEEWSRDNYLGGYTSYGSMTDLHLRYPHFEELAKNIDRHVRKFARHLEMDLQGGHLRMVTCWVNIMPSRTTHSGHIHPLSVISGTYYVKVPRDSSAIKFEDPRLERMMAAPPKLDGAKPRNQQHVKLNPRAGQVALWESWLRHEVPPNPSREDRISISFNYDWV